MEIKMDFKLLIGKGHFIFEKGKEYIGEWKNNL